jgi:uncharacterized protein DUF6476
MRALKVLVIVMGVMLVVGTALVVATIAERVARGRQDRAGGVASGAIAVPAGARVEAMTASGDRLILALALADGSRQLLVVDLAHAKALSTIALRPAP